MTVEDLLIVTFGVLFATLLVKITITVLQDSQYPKDIRHLPPHMRNIIMRERTKGIIYSQKMADKIFDAYMMKLENEESEKTDET
jgi:hypothetical protein